MGIIHWRYRWTCHRLQRQNAAYPPEVDAYIAALPALHSQRLDQTPLLALDLELTGLDPQRDAIIAMGHVALDHGRIRLDRAQETHVRPTVEVGQSATCHQLTDSQLAHAPLPGDALLALLDALRGRVLVCHHAPLDLSFLRAQMRRLGWPRLPLPAIDTLAIEAARRRRKQPDLPLSRLRLPDCRADYHLPPYPGHHALADALACAELLLAQHAHGIRGPLLAEWICRF